MKKAFFLVAVSVLLLVGCFERNRDEMPEPLDGQCNTVVKDSLAHNMEILPLDAESLRRVICEAWETSNVREFKDLDEFIIVDVRGFDLYSDNRIRGSVNVELKDIRNEANCWEKCRRIVLYSSNKSCPLAGKAARRLLACGFSKVFVYEGGMEEWVSKGFEIDGPCHQIVFTVCH